MILEAFVNSVFSLPGAASRALFRAVKVGKRRLATGPVREWPTTSALIDVVSVVEESQRERGGDKTTGYAATLTYFYRNPELQIGEYKRIFQLAFEAQVWAAKHKGKNVVVHVNPRDPSDSELLIEDLEGLTHIPELGIDAALYLEQLPRLNRAWLFVSGLSELVAVAGISLTVIKLGHRGEQWITFALIYMSIFNFVSTILITYHLDESTGYQAIFRSYKRFCPAWMKWGVSLSGALLIVLLTAEGLMGFLPEAKQRFIYAADQYFPYMLSFWCFFSSAGLHAVILRAQTQTQRATDDDLRRNEDAEIRSTWWNER